MACVAGGGCQRTNKGLRVEGGGLSCVDGQASRELGGEKGKRPRQPWVARDVRPMAGECSETSPAQGEAGWGRARGARGQGRTGETWFQEKPPPLPKRLSLPNHPPPSKISPMGVGAALPLGRPGHAPTHARGEKGKGGGGCTKRQGQGTKEGGARAHARRVAVLSG